LDTFDYFLFRSPPKQVLDVMQAHAERIAIDRSWVAYRARNRGGERPQ
jgi:hypothetical protein